MIYRLKPSPEKELDLKYLQRTALAALRKRKEIKEIPWIDPSLPLDMKRFEENLVMIHDEEEFMAKMKDMLDKLLGENHLNFVYGFYRAGRITFPEMIKMLEQHRNINIEYVDSLPLDFDCDMTPLENTLYVKKSFLEKQAEI